MRTRVTSGVSLPMPRAAGDATGRRGTVVFELTRWATWRPVGTEAVTAIRHDDDTATLVQPPFLVRGASSGDRVRIIGSGEPGSSERVAQIVGRSGRSVLRVEAGAREELRPLAEWLRADGLTARLHPNLPLIAIDVPAERPLETLMAALDHRCGSYCGITVTSLRHLPGT